MTGLLAVSCAGHDRGSFYLIIGETKDCVYLADGVYKTFAAPKKKNRKHVRAICGGLSGREMEELRKNPADADTKIKRCIKQKARNGLRNMEE